MKITGSGWRLLPLASCVIGLDCCCTMSHTPHQKQSAGQQCTYAFVAVGRTRLDWRTLAGHVQSTTVQGGASGLFVYLRVSKLLPCTGCFETTFLVHDKSEPRRLRLRAASHSVKPTLVLLLCVQLSLAFS